jgi:hypothetical protein
MPEPRRKQPLKLATVTTKMELQVLDRPAVIGTMQQIADGDKTRLEASRLVVVLGGRETASPALDGLGMV